MPPLARVSAQLAPPGPPPMTATRKGRSNASPSLIAKTWNGISRFANRKLRWFTCNLVPPNVELDAPENFLKGVVRVPKDGRQRGQGVVDDETCML